MSASARQLHRTCVHEAGHAVIAMMLGMKVRDIEAHTRARLDKRSGRRILGIVRMDTSSRVRWRLSGNSWEARRVNTATHRDDLRLLGLAGEVAALVIVDGLTDDAAIIERIQLGKADATLARGHTRGDVVRVIELIREHRSEIESETLRIFKNTARRERTTRS